MGRMGRALVATAVVAAAVPAALLADRVTPAGAVPAATAGQVVTVRTASAGATRGVLEAWQRQPNGSYRRVRGPVTAWVGARGVGATREGLARTPAGVFTLTESFGTAADPGTALPYRRVDRNDWWVSETRSAAYNTHRRCAPGRCPFDERASERLAIPAYRHAVVIDYNRRPVVRGAGSAFFLHLANGRPTAGCVAVAAAELTWLLRWLRPAARPVVSIGVGAAATAGVARANKLAAARNPVGVLDAATALGGGRVRVRGWAFDPDARSAVLPVHVYADGRLVAALRTGTPRADVARVRRAGPNQGFSGPVRLGRGRHTVCAYAINIRTGTGNPRLGCRAVTVT